MARTQSAKPVSTARQAPVPVTAIKPPAVLIGLESMQGLQTARILASHEVPVFGVVRDRQHSNCRTNVCERIIQAETQTAGLIDSLVALAAEIGENPILIPCEDTSVLLVSRHRERLQQHYRMNLPEAEVVERLMNKATFYRYAQQNALPIPETHFVSNLDDAKKIAENISYPCILKPNARTASWINHTALKAFRIENAAELLRIVEQYGSYADMLIVQQLIRGNDSEHFTCSCYFDLDGVLQTTFTSRKIRQWPPATGQRCLGVECRDETVRQEAVRLFQQVDYRGLGYIEMKRDSETGTYYIIEPNIVRPTGPQATAEAAGVSFIYTLYCDLLGWPLPGNLTQSFNGVKWIHIRRDLLSAFYYWRRGELTFLEWWRSVRGKKAYAVFSWRDPMPFFGDFIRMLKLALSPTERRKRLPQNQEQNA